MADNYRDALTKKGYKVSIYHDKPSAMAALSGELPDLVLVDIGLGDDEDAGFDMCNQLLSRSETLPILFLTARDT
ncbi:MAG: response regulator [Pseudomonadota bacterium]|nr:response regulator [Pseudomonadota bacterium]